MLLFRSLVFALWMYGLMAVMGLICLPTLLMPRRAPLACMAVWRRLVLWGLKTFCGVTFEVRGRANMPSGGALVAMKHHSMFETIIAWEFIPDPAIILKKALVYFPVFGWYAVKLRNIVIDRAAASKALRQMLKDASQRVSEGRQVVIFPEGTRTEPGQRAPYKPGVVALYRELGVACVPIAHNSGLCWPAHGVIRRPGKITFEILPPIPPGLPKAEFMATLEERIETAAAALLPPGFTPPQPAAPVPATAAGEGLETV
jgi:1-acyl-sn-glycerol-3-phosphate acyltransferase